MARSTRLAGVADVVRARPLQAAKFAGVLCALVLGVGGFFRVFDARAIVDHPVLGDGQFLALVLLPVVGLVLVVVVFLEALATGYRLHRSDEPVRDRVATRPGYALVRGAEAAVAVVGVLLGASALPVLFADATPAPAGVGILLLLLVVAVGILVASLVRSFADLFVYRV
ncbi:MAG: hypothetical protein ABEJ23_08060 [Haloarculaceae archaeon]